MLSYRHPISHWQAIECELPSFPLVLKLVKKIKNANFPNKNRLWLEKGKVIRHGLTKSSNIGRLAFLT
jgi:hypothetical protein